MFEDICHLLCELTGYKMCYIVTKSSDILPTIISQSGYLCDYLKEAQILDKNDVMQIYKKVEEELQDGYTRKKYDEKKSDCLIIEVYHAEMSEPDNSFYVILQKDSNSSPRCF
jgi:hypothetical protein